jgi:uncharacterized protein (TIGR02001 family)
MDCFIQGKALRLCQLLLLSPFLPAMAAEGDPPPAPALTANVTFASQYISRGFRQTWGKPALQGGADYVHPSGWSAGIWGSTVSDRFVEKASLEVDLYGGYTGAAGDVGYSVLVYYYAYPGAEYTAGPVTYNYGELSGGLTWKFAYAKYNYTFTPEFFGITHARGTGYLDIGANIELATGLMLNLHLGQGRVAGAGNEVWNWRDAKVGLTKSLDRGWTLIGALTKAKGATTIYDHYTLGIPNSAGVIESSNPAKATLVVSIGKTF